MQLQFGFEGNRSILIVADGGSRFRGNDKRLKGSF